MFLNRVFDNKSAKVEWIVNAIVERMRSNGNMTVNEVISDMRTRFSIGISFPRAVKARKLAKNMVDGDADRQYSLLWSYSEELRRANLETLVSCILRGLHLLDEGPKERLVQTCFLFPH
jgi:hypothetical protein